MPSGLSFNLFGIPIRIDPSFFILALFIGIGAQSTILIVSFVAVVTVSVLAHELGHAVAFRLFDRQPNIVLQWLGGVTFAPGGLTAARNLVVSLAGPLTGLLLIGLPALIVAQGVPDDGSTWSLLLAQIIWVNIVWSLFNLAPVLPLDGGNVTASALHFIVGAKAMRVTHAISMVVALAAGIWAWITGIEYIFLMLFAGFLAYWNFSQLRNARPHEAQTELYDGYQAIGRGDVPAAIRQAERVIEAGPPDHVLAAAIELEAWARVYGGDAASARTALNGLPAGTAPNLFLVGSIALVEGRNDDALTSLSAGFRVVQFGPWSSIVARLTARAGLVDALLDRLVADERVGVGPLMQFQSHLHYAGCFRDAARAGERAFAAGPAEQGQAAYNIACDWALAGDPEIAMAWLERAVALGFATRQQINDDPDLTSLRANGRYAALLERLPGA